MNNIKYWDLANIERSLKSNLEDSLYNVYRVLRVNEFINGGTLKDPYELLDAMKRAKMEAPIFNGDEKIFFAYYTRLSELSVREVVEYINLLLKNDRPGYGAMVPTSLSSIMFKNVKNVSSSLVIDCEKYGVELYDLILANPSIKFYLTVKSSVLQLLLKKIYSQENVEFINPEIYTYGFTVQKFDRIIAFPIMGGRDLNEQGDFISRELSFIAAQNLLYHLTPAGKLIIVLPAKIGFAGGDAEVLRNYISQNYQVNSISSLPARVFYPYMAINTYLLDISQGITDTVEMSKYMLNKNKDGVEELIINDNRLLFADELEVMNSWNVDMAFSITDEIIMNYKNSSVKKAALKDVAEVFRGKAVTKAESGNVAVINISNISETGIDYENLDTIDDEERKVARYLLQEGDVLIATKGFAVKIAVFEKQSRLVIASSNLCVIRPNQRLINGTYLKLFLESETGMKLIKSLQRGTTIVNINYQDLCELEVPVPPMEEQFDIANEYTAGLRLYKQTIEAANDAWSKIKDSVQRKLF